MKILLSFAMMSLTWSEDSHGETQANTPQKLTLSQLFDHRKLSRLRALVWFCVLEVSQDFLDALPGPGRPFQLARFLLRYSEHLLRAFRGRVYPALLVQP